MKLTCIKVIPYLKMGELVHGELKNHIYIFLHILFFNWLGGFIIKKICKNDLYSSAQTYHHSWPTSFKINQAMRFTICKSGKLKIFLIWRILKMKLFPKAGKWRFNCYIVIWFYFIKMDSISSILKMKLFPMAGK